MPVGKGLGAGHVVRHRFLKNIYRGLSSARRPATAALAIALVACIGGPAISQDMSERNYRCAQLEQDLANDWAADSRSSQDELPRIESELRDADRAFRNAEAQMDRADCYENFFIFGRGLVRTPRCLKLNSQMEDARRRLSQLQEQRQAVRQSGGGGRQNRVMEALARYGCGDQYRREATRRRGGGGFFDWLAGEEPGGNMSTSEIVPYGSYRTLCVRSCDGFYFPVSYSAVPSRFSADAAQCQSQCAAPAELFVYRNPGEQVQQAVSLSGRAYSQLPNAFRYRKEYVKGCSCKQAEFNPAEVGGEAKKSDAAPAANAPAQAEAKTDSD